MVRERKTQTTLEKLRTLTTCTSNSTWSAGTHLAPANGVCAFHQNHPALTTGPWQHFRTPILQVLQQFNLLEGYKDLEVQEKQSFISSVWWNQHLRRLTFFHELFVLHKWRPPCKSRRAKAFPVMIFSSRMSEELWQADSTSKMFNTSIIIVT